MGTGYVFTQAAKILLSWRKTYGDDLANGFDIFEKKENGPKMNLRMFPASTVPTLERLSVAKLM